MLISLRVAAELAARTTLLVCFGVALLLAPRAEAAARRPRVAVAPFSGAGARRVQAVVIYALRKRAVVIRPDRWAKAAAKLGRAATDDEQVAAVASSVRAKWVMTGGVERSGRRSNVVVLLRRGDSGAVSEQVKLPLRSGRVTAAVQSRLAREVGLAYERALASEAVPKRAPASPPAQAPAPPRAQAPPPAATLPARPPPSRQPQPSAPVAQARIAEPTLAPVRLERRAPPRPAWRPYVDVAAGVSVTGRSFKFDVLTEPRFKSGAAPGLRAEVTLYPLASLHHVAHGIFAGLGIGGSVDKPFWPDSTSTDGAARLGTSELRLEGALRWAIAILERLPRPELIVEAGGGLHNFSISRDASGAEVGPAKVSYRYVTLGGGARFHLGEALSVWAIYNQHLVQSAGAIQSAAEYGRASTTALRARGGIDWVIYKGLKVGGVGFYERFGLTFQPGTPAPQKMAGKATDQYFGGTLLVGYVF